MRRLVAPATVTACLLAVACGGPTSSFGTAAATSSTGVDRPVSAATSTVAPTSTVVSSIAAPSRSPSSAVGVTPTTDPPVSCPPAEVIVVGNSTDYTPVTSETIAAPSPNAWPAVADQLVAELEPDLDVVVTNASVRGAGIDVAMLLASTIRDHVAELASVASERSRLLVLVPSVIDLQLKDLDVERSIDAFTALIADARGWFDAVAVTPMTPVAAGLDTDLSAAIDAFNRRLDSRGLLAASWTASPLLASGSLGGAPEYFDDFDDEALATSGPDPDGVHPDVDGHRRTAEIAAPWIVERVRQACRTRWSPGSLPDRPPSSRADVGRQ